MIAIDNLTAVALRPAPGAVGTVGYFTGGDPNANPPVPATVLDTDWLNRLQVEILTVILAAGISPSKSDSTQLYQAIQFLISAWSGQVKTYAGDPNGNVSGAAGTSTTPPTFCVNLTTADLYVCKTSGNAASAVWVRPANAADLAALFATLAQAKAGTLSTKAMTPATASAVDQQRSYTYAQAGGTANALTVTLTPAPAAYTVGMEIEFRVTTDNTGASTLNVNGLGSVSMVTHDNQIVQGGDLRAGRIVKVSYDGAAFQLTSPRNGPPPVDFALLLIAGEDD